MRKLDFQPTFKSEMSNIEIEGVESIVKKFKYESGDLQGGDVEFAYTSSSDYATHNVMSPLYVVGEEEHEGEGYEVSHVAITENGMLILVCSDENENEHFFEIEPSDF